LPQTDVSWKEMMAIFFARDLRDGDRVCSGAHTEITFAAAMMAQKSHAPNLKLQLGGTCYLCNVTGQEIDELPPTSVDFRISQWAEEYHDHPETFLFFGPPGRRRYLEEPERLRDTNKYFVGDKFFVGGIQADKYGATNLIGIGKPGKWKLRGPGTVGICDIVTVRDAYIFLTAHTRDRLVERVDYVSFPGWETWGKYGHLGHGAKYIVTPKAVFDRDPETGTARLVATFPGTSLEDVRENTGFAFPVAENFAPVPPPSKEELDLLRNHIDKTGTLRT
jgi:glutaconate CoA-transferase subunit B